MPWEKLDCQIQYLFVDLIQNWYISYQIILYTPFVHISNNSISYRISFGSIMMLYLISKFKIDLEVYLNAERIRLLSFFN